MKTYNFGQLYGSNGIDKIMPAINAATTDNVGGIKVGFTSNNSSDIPVKLDKDGRAYVTIVNVTPKPEPVASVGLSASTNLVERNANTKVTLTVTSSYDGGSAEELTIPNVELVGDSNSRKTAVVTVNDTTSYTVTAKFKGDITKTASTTVTAYSPMYFGSSANTKLIGDDVIKLIKQPYKNSPLGKYTIHVNQSEYLWICIPENMSFDVIKSNGFEIPLDDVQLIDVPNRGKYKCYRSYSQFNDGDVKISIENN